MKNPPNVYSVKTAEQLRRRLKDFFDNRAAKQSCNGHDDGDQLLPDILPGLPSDYRFETTAGRSVVDFIDLVSATLPADYDIYLFGGIVRDLVFYYPSMFYSDIDVVVSGPIENVTPLLLMYGAKKNKFGGYRTFIGGWPMDVWAAEDTWAVKQGLVGYKGIGSLTETTILNWDAILMNWRTKGLIFQPNYFEMVGQRKLDILLKENPNPLGMLVRTLRQLILKRGEATPKAAEYLREATSIYTYQDVKEHERSSFHRPIIVECFYHRFKQDTGNSLITPKATPMTGLAASRQAQMGLGP